jgi:transposase InsO family protein
MRLSASEKQEIIRMVDQSDIGVNKTLKEIGVNKSTFYKWYNAYSKDGIDGLEPHKRASSRQQWNTIPQAQKNLVVEIALDYPHLSPRELAYRLTDEQQIFISESSVYRILKNKGLITSPAHILLAAGNEFQNKTSFVHQMWQTDFTYFKIIGWGWYYLSTVLDDFSRYIVHWELCKSMEADDVKRTVDRAVAKARLKTKKRPKLLCDNGSCYISKGLKEHLNNEHDIDPIHGRPYHPQTQGKIERYHRTMKNVIKLDNYYSPEELERALEGFVKNYNNERYHESLDNLTPADVYYGRGEQILMQREFIKQTCLKERKLNYLKLKVKNNLNNLVRK